MIKRKYNIPRDIEPKEIHHEDGTVTHVDGIVRKFIDIKEVPHSAPNLFITKQDKSAYDYCKRKGLKRSDECLAMTSGKYVKGSIKCIFYEECDL